MGTLIILIGGAISFVYLSSVDTYVPNSHNNPLAMWSSLVMIVLFVIVLMIIKSRKYNKENPRILTDIEVYHNGFPPKANYKFNENTETYTRI